ACKIIGNWRGHNDVMQTRSFRGSGEPAWVIASSNACFGLGPDPRRALGPAAIRAASTGRTHDRTRPMLHQRQKALVNQAPSTHDPKRTSAWRRRADPTRVWASWQFRELLSLDAASTEICQPRGDSYGTPWLSPIGYPHHIRVGFECHRNRRICPSGTSQAGASLSRRDRAHRERFEARFPEGDRGA